MSTPLTDSIQNLTSYINEVTGGDDANLSDAIHTLADGYGETKREIVTLSTKHTNTSTLAQELLSLVQNPKNDYLYCFIRINSYSSIKEKSICAIFCTRSNDVLERGNSLRRTSTKFEIVPVSTAYDAYSEIGDSYIVLSQALAI